MANYYHYDAPDGFTPDDELEIFVPMEQPEIDVELIAVSKHEAHFHGTDKVRLPYPRGARVGVREEFIYCGGDGKETCDNPDGGDCPGCDGKGWVVTVHYIVTEVDVVYLDGRWFEKVTMSRET